MSWKDQHSRVRRGGLLKLPIGLNPSVSDGNQLWPDNYLKNASKEKYRSIDGGDNVLIDSDDIVIINSTLGKRAFQNANEIYAEECKFGENSFYGATRVVAEECSFKDNCFTKSKYVFLKDCNIGKRFARGASHFAYVIDDDLKVEDDSFLRIRNGILVVDKFVSRNIKAENSIIIARDISLLEGKIGEGCYLFSTNSLTAKGAIQISKERYQSLFDYWYNLIPKLENKFDALNLLYPSTPN